MLVLMLAALSCGRGPQPLQPGPQAEPPASQQTPPSSDPQPSQPSLTPFFVYGSVRDTHLNGLAGVPVEVVDGPMSGTSVVTDGHGFFKFASVFEEATQFRASKPGYTTATVTAPRPTIRTVGGPQTMVTIELPLPEPALDITGPYTFTVGNAPA